MSPASKAVEVNVDGRVLKLTNLDKVLWPEVGFNTRPVRDGMTDGRFIQDGIPVPLIAGGPGSQVYVSTARFS